MLKLKTIMKKPRVQVAKFSVSPIQLVKEVEIELKKVKWPTKQEVVKMTTIVVSVSIIVGLLIGLADLVLTKLMSLIIK